MNLQGRLEIQSAAQNWVNSMMQQYQIQPSVMIEALNKVMVDLKDQLIIELFAEAAQMQQQMEEEHPHEHPHEDAPAFVVDEGDKDGDA